MLFGFVSTVFLALTSVAHAVPASLLSSNNGTTFSSTVESTSLRSRAVPAYYWYYGNTAAEHQAKFNDYSSRGFKMISLSVYGSPPGVLYAAVWVQRAGQLWRAIHGVSAASYQSWFDTNLAAGYVSTIVTVTGPIGSEIYAGVMEQISVGSWNQRCGLSPSDLQSTTDTAAGNNQILKLLRQYGTTSNPRYCALYHANPQRSKWTFWYGMNYGTWQVRDGAERAKRFWKPTFVSSSEEGVISAIYSDQDTGAVREMVQMTKADLDNYNPTATAAGLYLVSLQGSGSGSNIRYAGIWAERDQPLTRTWSNQGTATGFRNTAGISSEIDTTFQNFMKSHGIRQGQLSVYKAGSALLDRGFTWAESSRARVQPGDKFLLASVSKMFCAASIQKLYDTNKLQPSTKAFQYLGITTFKDPRLANITIDNLVRHYGGWDIAVSNYDVVFNMRNVGFTFSPPRAVDPIDLVNYMASQKTLDHAPGSTYAYSNFGYVVLQVVIEKATNLPYFNYLQSTIAPTYSLRAWTDSPTDHLSDAIDQESYRTGFSAADPLNPYPIPNAYSGDGLRRNADLSGGSLATSASTLAKFAATHAVWDIGGRSPGSLRYGSIDGASSCVSSRSDGLDFAIVINTRDFFNGQPTAWTDICTTVITGILNRYPTI